MCVTAHDARAWLPAVQRWSRGTYHTTVLHSNTVLATAAPAVSLP